MQKAFIGSFRSSVDPTSQGATSPTRTRSATTLNSSAIPGSTTETIASAEGAKTKVIADENEFSKILKQTTGMTAADSVSEEALFAAVSGERVKSALGRDAYRSYLSFIRDERENAGERFSFEESAKKALVNLIEKGMASEKKIDRIYSRSFAAAQLDNRSDSLFDSIGGRGDRTVAVSSGTSAINSAVSTLNVQADGASFKLRSIFEKPYKHR